MVANPINNGIHGIFFHHQLQDFYGIFFHPQYVILPDVSTSDLWGHLSVASLASVAGPSAAPEAWPGAGRRGRRAGAANRGLFRLGNPWFMGKWGDVWKGNEGELLRKTLADGDESEINEIMIDYEIVHLSFWRLGAQRIERKWNPGGSCTESGRPHISYDLWNMCTLMF